MSRPDKCPNCGVLWHSIYSMPEELFNTGRYSTMKEAEEEAHRGWGWTKENCKDVRFSKHVVGIEDIDKYDGVSSWYCQSCDAHVDRWTGKITHVSKLRMPECPFSE